MPPHWRDADPVLGVALGVIAGTTFLILGNTKTGIWGYFSSAWALGTTLLLLEHRRLVRAAGEADEDDDDSGPDDASALEKGREPSLEPDGPSAVAEAALDDGGFALNPESPNKPVWQGIFYAAVAAGAFSLVAMIWFIANAWANGHAPDARSDWVASVWAWMSLKWAASTAASIRSFKLGTGPAGYTPVRAS